MSALKKIVILLDDDGNAEIRSPNEMSDDEVLDILTLAVDATADRILSVKDDEHQRRQALEATVAALPKKREYMN